MRYLACVLLLVLFVCPNIARAETGYLQVTCEPKVRIFIDDEFIGVTNEVDNGLFVEGLLPGEYSIKAVKTGFGAVSKQVTVITNQAVEVRFSFEGQSEQQAAPAPASKPALANVGTFILSSDPVGARIYIDGEYKGDADIVVQNKQAGRYNIVFEHGTQKLAGSYYLKKKEILKLKASFKRGRIINITEQEKAQRK